MSTNPLPLPQVKILIIDDEKGIRDSFKNYLEDCDFEIILAQNGQIGIDLIELENPDLVLTDLMMPQKNGFEVLDWIKQNKPELPVIGVSGAGMISDAVKAIHKGAWDYILKPVQDLEVILHAIEKSLERARLIRQNKVYQQELELKVEEKTKALKISQDRLTSIIKTIPDIIYRLSSEGTITYISDAIQLYGYVPEDLVGQNIYSIIHPEDGEKAMFHVDERRGKERNAGITEVRIFTKEQKLTFEKNGSSSIKLEDYLYFLIESEGVYDEGQPVYEIQGIARDITALKKERIEKQLAKEEALRYEIKAKNVIKTSQERFKNLLEASFDGIVIHKNGKFIEVNEGLLKLLNITSSKIEGQTLFDYLPKSEHELVFSNISQTENRLYETVVIPVGGKPIAVEAVGTSHTINGDSVRITGFRDITKQKEAEKIKSEFLKTLEKKVEERTYNLNEKNEKLKKTLKVLEATQEQLIQKEKMASLGNLVFGISHEVNTPLGICVTAASHLKEEAKKILELSKEKNLRKSMFDQFLEVTQESTRLVSENLDKAANLMQQFKKISIDSRSEEKSEFNLCRHIQLILSAYQEKMSIHQHQFVFQCPENLSLSSYSTAYTQLFTHLIDNSLLHGFQGKENRTITIHIVRTKSHIQIRYSDNGVGFQEAEIGKIFEPFYTTKRSSGCTGLGLHIISTTVALKLSGTIKCVQQETGGVEFQIDLPLFIDE